MHVKRSRREHRTHLVHGPCVICGDYDVRYGPQESRGEAIGATSTQGRDTVRTPGEENNEYRELYAERGYKERQERSGNCGNEIQGLQERGT